MDRGNIISGSAFRVTVYATVMLVVVSGAVAFAGYRGLQAELREQIRLQLGSLVEVLRTVQETDGDTVLVERARIVAP